eukprot:7723003-Pyramimonas_sp.AAC.1
MKKCALALAETAGTQQAKARDGGEIQRMPTVKTMERDICHSTQHFRRECPQGDGRGRGPSMHLAQTDSDVEYVDWESLLADSADSSATIVHFMAA